MRYYTMYNRTSLNNNRLDDWRNVVKHLLIVQNVKRTRERISEEFSKSLYTTEGKNDVQR